MVAVNEKGQKPIEPVSLAEVNARMNDPDVGCRGREHAGERCANRRLGQRPLDRREVTRVNRPMRVVVVDAARTPEMGPLGPVLGGGNPSLDASAKSSA
jgi:hypothetical protein